ncbi:MAG: MtrB/PioB family decaheme-associated outer membrane protein [Halioglobus sp.]
MKSRLRLLRPFTAASSLVLATCGALAQTVTPEADDTSATAPLALENRPALTDWLSGSTNAARVGLGYTSDDNYMFGEYNGLSQQGPTVIGDLQWQDFHNSDNYWQLSLSNLGLDTRQGELTWGRQDRLRFTMGFDSQQQVRNDSGQTPYRGNVNQYLPGNWVSGVNTGEFATLYDSLRDFDRVIDRDKVYMGVEARIDDNWRFRSNLSYEQKEGHGDTGAAIYINGASAEAVLLRAPIDYGTTEFDMGLAYDAERLHLDGQLAYSNFNNDHKLLVWQNPYSAFGPDVAYPNGTGGLGLAPDNEQTSGRLTGQYIFSTTTRLQFDGSYALAAQDQNYPDYTVNPALVVTVPVPRQDFNGKVATSTANIRLLLNPMPKLNTEVFYKLRDRDYDTERDGYLYVRGDGSNQPGTPETVYNTNHDLTSQTAGFEAGYRLPLHSKLGFEYAYEEVKRRNAPVEKTEEDRYTLKYRIQPWSNFSSNVHLEYGDRAADTYEWAQDYYALLDTELINITPDNQRYITHPLLMKYYMANRQQWETGADLSYLPTERWNLNLNLLWRNDNYDKSTLGLTESKWYRAQFSASYLVSDSLSGSVYTGYDTYKGNQQSRAFRGGLEKDAFAIYPPLPQASDPDQDWELDATDISFTLGANLQWQLAPDMELKLDYSFVDTRAQQDLTTQPGGSVTASDLPDVNTKLHHVQASGIWHLRDNLSLQLDYQYYLYKSDDWAWENVQANTIANVLTFGQTNPNEDIQYVGASVIYSWQ